jgi:hypothetical protein
MVQRNFKIDKQVLTLNLHKSALCASPPVKRETGSGKDLGSGKDPRRGN